MTINGEHVDTEVFSNEFRRLMQSQADRPVSMKIDEERVREIARENVIAGTLVSQEARKRVPSISDSEVKHRMRQLKKQYGEQVPLEQFVPRIENEIRIDKMYRELYKTLPKITQEQARKAFEENPDAYKQPEQVHCSHIVRHTFGGADPNISLQQIMEAQDRLRQGEPFESVSRRFSDEHGQAGDLGTFSRGRMVDKFENVVFRMKAGEISDVFKTEFGYHIVLLHEKIPERQRTFEEAKNDVVRDLQEAARRNAIEALIDDLKASAEIEEDEEE